MKFSLIIIATILSSALCLPVAERKRRSASSTSSVLTAITGAELLNKIINDISILQLYRQRMYTGAKSICEAFTQIKYTNGSSPISTTNASCSDSVSSSVIVNSLRTSSCSWINGGSGLILPECKSHPQEVDLTCHEMQLADLAYKVKVTLPGSNFYRVRDNLNSWVSRFVDRTLMSDEAYQLISRQVY